MRRRFNIAIVTHAYYPQYGGVTEHVHHAALELRKRGHRVTIITCGHGGRANYPEGNNVIRLGSNVLIRYNKAYVNLTTGWNVYGKMRRLLCQGQYDVVHVHCPLVPVLPLAATRTAGDALLFGTFHASAESSAGYFLFKPFLKRYHRKLDGRIAVSEPARDFVRKYFGGDYRIIPNGVDPSRFNPDNPPIEELADGKLNVLFVGRPDPRKGLEYLIRSMEIVRSRSKSPVRLVVIGDGPKRRTYEAMVGKRHRDSVLFLGSVGVDLLPRYFSSAHAFCSPATGNESFGIVLLEAMASGVPIVASDIPGYRTVVTNGQEGFLTKPRDLEAMARALLLLLDDRRLREDMGAKGRQKALRYSWAKIAEQTEQYYVEAMASKAGRSRK
ncbi:MAG: glycosyltransferase family 4 protein [Candidatus Eisenbacteria bacterium]|nr:glycosyltransferase family 4 protein [Candidatus Eisenbacteria bacterium]